MLDKSLGLGFKGDDGTDFEQIWKRFHDFAVAHRLFCPFHYDAA